MRVGRFAGIKAAVAAATLAVGLAGPAVAQQAEASREIDRNSPGPVIEP